jgi:hypothetical protein
MNTDDLLILYTALSLIDTLEETICTSFEATPRAPVDQYLCLHIARDADGNYLSIGARKHVYNFIWHMGQDPHSGITVKTPLDPHVGVSVNSVSVNSLSINTFSITQQRGLAGRWRRRRKKRSFLCAFAYNVVKTARVNEVLVALLACCTTTVFAL